MKKVPKRHCFFLLFCLILLISSIYISISTISYAENRIKEEINNTPIALDTTNQEVITDTMLLGEETPEDMIVEETNSFTNTELIVIIVCSVVSILAILSIIITNLGKLKFSESFSTSKRLIYYVMFLIILGVLTPTITIITSDNKILNGSNMKKRDEKSIAIVEITQDEKASALKEESIANDTSVLQVSNNSNFIANQLELLKSSGTTTDIESSLYYGLNSALIIKDGSSSELSDSNIITKANYSTAFYVTGIGSSAILKKTNLSTNADNSNGITASDTSEVNADNITIYTIGKNSSAVKTMNEDSTITISNSTLETAGTASPLFNSNGKIEVFSSNGTSQKSRIGIIKGQNSLSISDSEFTIEDIELNNKNETPSVFLIYNEVSKNASANFGSSSFTITNSIISLSEDSKYYQTSPLFHVTNSTSIINITDTKLNYGSDILLRAVGSSYGDIDDNGADVNLTATDQYLVGNVEIDELSKVRLHLNSSTYKGQINKDNLSKNVDITFDKQSKWILTGDSYINTLTIQNGKISRLKKCISSNGYDIYYNANDNEWLNNQTIRLTGGGKLIPVFES